MPDGSDDVSIPMRDEEIGAIRSKPILALLFAAFAVVAFPRTSGATNYHEYKKFDLSGPTEKGPSRCHANLKERRNDHCCDKWWEFLHQDKRHCGFM